MYCLYCGNELSDDAEFCSNCGTKINIKIPNMEGINTNAKSENEKVQNTEESFINKNIQDNVNITPQTTQKGILMEKKEPLKNEMPLYPLFWILIGGCVGLVLGIFTGNLTGVLLLGGFGCIIGLTIWIEKCRWKSATLDLKKFYLPKAINDNEVFNIMIRFADREQMKVEQPQNGKVRISYKGLQYDVIINNKYETFRIISNWPTGKYIMTPLIISKMMFKRDYLKKIEGLGYIAYILQNAMMGNI